jgi:hypothetical protein
MTIAYYAVEREASPEERLKIKFNRVVEEISDRLIEAQRPCLLSSQNVGSLSIALCRVK